jgi:tetraacyldisaccharide 4'-kinase
MLWAALTPAAAAYRVALGARAIYWRGMRREARPIVISVGNLTVGGNAKTPFAMFVATRLRERGVKVAIVSRGWGRRASRVRAALVSDGERLLMGPEEAGDEAVMMAKSWSGPIAIARRRIHAIRLIEERLGAVDAVVLDDAFQHVRLARDVDLLLISAEHGMGNGWVLPAGPMREPLAAARRADAVIVIEPAGIGAPEANGGGAPLPPALSAHPLLLRAALRPRSLVGPSGGAGWTEMPAALTGRRVLAVSGLADARGFYRMLRELDADLVGVLDYPDHHVYNQRDWQNIVAAARAAGAVAVTTEKDLVKLERFPFERDSLYALRVEIAMEPGDEARLLEIFFGERPTSGAASGENR